MLTTIRRMFVTAFIFSLLMTGWQELKILTLDRQAVTYETDEAGLINLRKGWVMVTGASLVFAGVLFGAERIKKCR